MTQNDRDKRDPRASAPEPVCRRSFLSLLVTLRATSLCACEFKVAKPKKGLPSSSPCRFSHSVEEYLPFNLMHLYRLVAEVLLDEGYYVPGPSQYVKTYVRNYDEGHPLPIVPALEAFRSAQLSYLTRNALPYLTATLSPAESIDVSRTHTTARMHRAQSLPSTEGGLLGLYTQLWPQSGVPDLNMQHLVVRKLGWSFPPFSGPDPASLVPEASASSASTRTVT